VLHSSSYATPPNAPNWRPPSPKPTVLNFSQSAAAGRLRREVRGEVAFDAVTCGLYATDASIYQIEPLGVVVPRTVDDVIAVRSICAEAGVPILPRGGGTSQCGQTVNRAIVVDVSKYLCNVESVDVDAHRARVQPGVVLDRLNSALKKDGLFFPVDPSTASRATRTSAAVRASPPLRRRRRNGNFVERLFRLPSSLPF